MVRRLHEGSHEEVMPVSPDAFDDAITAYREALPAFLHGDPEPILDLYSRRDDVTLANPLGPPAHGRAEVEKAVRTASAMFESGTVSFEDVTRYGTPDLGYAVWIEPNEARLAATGEQVKLPLRVTMVFRREDDGWRIAHRHADPITTARPLSEAAR
jgi:ketosteroid isomerase-like protein